MSDEKEKMREEYDFSKGVRGKHAGKEIRIVGAVLDAQDDAGEAQGDEAAAPTSVSDILKEMMGGTFLDGFTLEEGEAPLPPEVAARLIGRAFRREVLERCRAGDCDACLSVAFDAQTTIECSHDCHTKKTAGG